MRIVVRSVSVVVLGTTEKTREDGLEVSVVIDVVVENGVVANVERIYVDAHTKMDMENRCVGSVLIEPA